MYAGNGTRQGPPGGGIDDGGAGYGVLEDRRYHPRFGDHFPAQGFQDVVGAVTSLGTVETCLPDIGWLCAEVVGKQGGSSLVEFVETPVNLSEFVCDTVQRSKISTPPFPCFFCDSGAVQSPLAPRNRCRPFRFGVVGVDREVAV